MSTATPAVVSPTLAKKTVDGVETEREESSFLCCATLADGRPCRYPATREGCLCGVHRRSEDLALTCAVCLGRVQRGRACRLGCGHVFHKRCIRRWFARQLTCPCCRAPCLDHLGTAGNALRHQMRLLLRTLPRPPTIYFPSYMIALMNSQPVVQALHLSADLRQLLADIAFFSFSEAQFLGFLDRFEL